MKNSDRTWQRVWYNGEVRKRKRRLKRCGYPEIPVPLICQRLAISRPQWEGGRPSSTRVLNLPGAGSGLPTRTVWKRKEDIGRAFQKIKLLLPGSVSVDFKDIGMAYSFEIENTTNLNKRSTMIFETLSRAIQDKKSIRVKYHKIDRNVTEKRVLDPYHLRHTLGAWYLIAYSHARKAIRTFVVNRIKEITVLEKEFEIQTDFSPEKMFADSWRLELGGPITKVKVKFHPDIAPWIRERRWHPSQETREHDDGSVTLTFKVAGTWEIKRWIMSFGSSAKVLEPEELREEILEEARWILKQE